MKIEKCPFCDKAVAEITNCKDLEGCRHFEKCPATEPYVCVVCNMFEGGCGASSGYYDSVEKAIAAWNRRAEHSGDAAEMPLTNADRIRSMSDEELAEYIFDLGNCSEYCYGHCAYQDDCNTEGLDHNTCIKGVIDWLKQPVKEDKPCG
jgi:hypothetical protein